MKTDFFPEPRPFEEGVTDIGLLRFHSTKNRIDPNKMIAKIGIDNVGLSTASNDVPAVPVPAAIWFFVSGLIGLKSLQNRKAG